MKREDYTAVVRQCPKLFDGYQVLPIALNAGETTATV
jgi:hypothetical protein